MPHPSKRKGDRAEREAAALIAFLLDLPARRELGAGRQDDVGDLNVPGLDGHVMQVASWADTARAALEKPVAAERQRLNRSAEHASTWVRFRGGTWRVVLTPDQWARLVRAIRPTQQ